jgi:hypothetical protein
VGLASGDLNKWALLLSGGAAAVLFLRAFWLRKGDAIWWAVAVEGLMALIALYALFGAVLPQLG